MKILVTGSNGQLGSELQTLASSFEAEFHFTDVTTLDILDKEKINSLFEEHHFDFCINCAAYTAVDKAEEDVDMARKINRNGPRNLAEICQKNKSTFIHVSSDYVYHNQVNRPMVETDPTTPKGIYALTKLEGDQAALAACDRTIIFRTSWVYSSFGNNFVKSMIKYGSQRDAMTIVFDQIGAPTYARDLAAAILQVIQQCHGENPHYGIFNYSNEGIASWYDFASAIFEMNSIPCKAAPILSKDYPTPAQRPTYSVMDKSKIKESYHLDIPHWRDSLSKCLNLINQSQIQVS